MDMLDWNLSFEIQENGRKMAKEIKNIKPFLQPLTSRHNKNVWENCALIITDRSDDELKTYLVELLEWLQDMNWPGAFYILNRLNNYSKDLSFEIAFQKCVERAKYLNDDIWLTNLLQINQS